MLQAQRLDPFAGLKRRWALEEDEAQRAQAHNKLLQMFSRTRYAVGEVVLLEGRERVEILEVFPAGYISVPRKHDVMGRLGEPVTCDCTLYRYRRLADPKGASGQTTESQLQPLTCPARS